MGPLRHLARCLLAAAALLIGSASFDPPLADGHGPCRCIVPRTAAPGDQLSIPVETLRAVWNPTSDDFIVELGGAGLTDWKHNPNSDSITLAESSPDDRAPVSVTVPDVPNGRYLLLVLDGREGGTHFTWDYIRVAARKTDEGSSSLVPIVLGTVATIALIGALVLRYRRRP